MPSRTLEPYRVLDQPHSQRRKWKIICVGAGASGLYLARRCEQRMKDYELTIYEKNSEVGGTWFENTYPGCACDIPSHIYTYSFRPNTNYTSYYAGNSEIQAYFKAYSDEFNLTRYIKFETMVTRAEWKDDEGVYEVDIRQQDGSVVKDWCNTLINCSGVLNQWSWPDIPGLKSFQGELIHSASWNHEIDYVDKRVGIIGAGSSGIQITPQVEKVASSLEVFIRNPVWITPQLGGMPTAEACPTDNAFLHDLLIRGAQPYDFSKEEQQKLAEDPELLLTFRKSLEIAICGALEAFKFGSEKQKAVFNFVTDQMRTGLGDNEEMKAKLIPKFPVGCRRPTPGAGYLAALTSEKTRVVFDPIAKVNKGGIVTKNGEEHKLDVLVCATGFNIGFIPPFPVVGKDGRELREEWTPDPNCYLGIAAPGFPNYFTPLGPRGPWGNGSVLMLLEQNLNYFITMMIKMQTQGIKSVMPRQNATDDFAIHADEWHKDSVWNQDCQSWYKRGGPNSKPYLWCGTSPSYLKTMGDVRFEDYEYEYHNQNRFAYIGNGLVAGDYVPLMEKPERLVPYIRLADTPFEVE